MQWKLDLRSTGAKPKYRRLMEFVAEAISSGRLRSGERIPSVVDLCRRLSVNQATVVRAFRELERRRLIVSHVGRGSFVAAAGEAGYSTRSDAAAEQGANGPGSRADVLAVVRRLRDAHVATIQQLLRQEPPGPYLNFWSGVPPDALAPRAMLERAVREAMRRHGEDLFRYSHCGLPRLRETLAGWLGGRGYRLSADQILITNGSQQALGLVATWALEERRAMVCETPTYVGIPRLFSQTGHLVESVPWDGRRLCHDRLLELARGRQAVVYCCPEFHNPTGESLDAAGRAALVDLARESDTVVVVDDIFRDMRFDGTEPPSLYEELPPSRRILVGSFSKSFTPGLRVGFLAADRSLIEKFAPIRRWADLGGPPLTHAIMERLLDRDYSRHLDTMRAHYRERRDAMCAALEKHLPSGAGFTRPDGGFQLWVRMPDGYSSIQLYLRALEQGVAICPGPTHDIDGRYLGCFRLGYGWASPQEIRKGIEILGRLMRGMLKEGPGEASVTGIGLPV